MINDAIAILQKHLAVENDNIGTALVELRAAQKVKPSPTDAPAPVGVDAPAKQVKKATASARVERDSELAPLLEDRREQIKKLEGARDQQVADLDRQLSDALGTLTPMHPQVLALKSRLEDAQKDPPELSTLRNDERAIVAQIAASAASAPSPQPSADKPATDSHASERRSGHRRCAVQAGERHAEVHRAQRPDRVGSDRARRGARGVQVPLQRGSSSRGPAKPEEA
jgi:hypothetical protein